MHLHGLCETMTDRLKKKTRLIKMLLKICVSCLSFLSTKKGENEDEEPETNKTNPLVVEVT